MGVSWSVRPPGWLPSDPGWVDPVGRTPVWSTVDFAAVAAALPQHALRYLVAEVDGAPALLAPLLLSPGPGGLLFYDVPAMIGDARAFGVEPPELADADRAALYPSVALAVHGAHHGVLVDPDLSDDLRRDLVGGLLDALTDAAADLGCASSALLYATPELHALLRPGPGHGTAVLGAESCLVSAASDFDGYLGELTSRRRTRARRERAMYLAGPARSEIRTGPDAIGDDLVDLRCALRERYGLPAHRERTVVEFDALVAHCGDRLLVNRSVLDGDTVGFVIALRHGDALYARTGGFDYDRLGPRDFCYFNIAYYDLLEWGLPRGVRSVELGLAAYPSKRTRGCRFEPRLGVFAVPQGSPARAVLAAQSGSEWDRLVAECGDGLQVPEGEDRPWT